MTKQEKTNLIFREVYDINHELLDYPRDITIEDVGRLLSWLGDQTEFEISADPTDPKKYIATYNRGWNFVHNVDLTELVIDMVVNYIIEKEKGID